MILVHRFLFIALLFYGFSGQAQSRADSTVYEVTAGWFDLGEMKAKWESNGDTLYVKNVSEVKFPFILGGKEMTYIAKVKMVSGVMQESKVDVYVNGEHSEYCYTTKETNQYKVVKRTDKGEVYSSIIERATIQLTTSLLLFVQPMANAEVYAELNTDLASVEQIDQEDFLLANKRTGKKTEYYYQNGKLKFSRMSNPFVDFEIKLKDAN